MLFFLSVSPTKYNKFVCLRQQSICAFFIQWALCMNVTIKWAIQIYRITHFFLVCPDCARIFIPKPYLKTNTSLFHILWLIYLRDSNEIYRILENNRKSFIRSALLSFFYCFTDKKQHQQQQQQHEKLK